MFWRTKDGGERPPDKAIPEIHTEEEFDRISRLDLAILFKHSPSCIVSRMASMQVQKFVAANPEVPVFLLSVLAERALARQIATRTGIRHESPQVIAFRNGKAFANTSHEGVNVAELDRIVTLKVPDSNGGN